jgi:hypothetical protein
MLPLLPSRITQENDGKFFQMLTQSLPLIFDAVSSMTSDILCIKRLKHQQKLDYD